MKKVIAKKNTEYQLLLEIVDRLRGIEGRLGKIESRLDKIETRMDNLEFRMDNLEFRMDKLESRMDALESRMDGFEVRLNDIEFRLLNIESQLTKQGEDIAAVRSTTILITKMVTVKFDEVMTYSKETRRIIDSSALFPN